MNCSNLCGQYKNRVYGKKNKILSNILTSFFKRSQFCFSLNTVVVVEVDVFGYDEASLVISGKFNSVDTFRFEN